MSGRDKELTAIVVQERGRLGSFIRARVRNPSDAEDILQDVLQEFVEAYRLPESIERVSGWLFRVARNRIIDLFRKKKEVSSQERGSEEPEDGEHRLDLLLPAPDGGPEAAYVRAVLLAELQTAIDALPAEQRDIFIRHELDGVSFKEMASRDAVSINTLLARKRYAVLQLRSRLQAVYEEFDI